MRGSEHKNGKCPSVSIVDDSSQLSARWSVAKPDRLRAADCDGMVALSVRIVLCIDDTTFEGGARRKEQLLESHNVDILRIAVPSNHPVSVC